MAAIDRRLLKTASGCLLLVLLALATPATASRPHRQGSATGTQQQQHLASSLGRQQIHRRLHHLGAQPSFQPCAINGAQAGPQWQNATVTCLEFHAAPSAPIQVPDDTATVKWGQLVVQSSNPLRVLFKDREGESYAVLDSAHPPQDFLAYQRSLTNVVVKVQLDGAGNVTSYSAEIYVPYSTILATLRDTQFEGTLFNSPPRPAGPNETSWIRWTFGRVITAADPTSKYGVLLQGTFDNLFRAVKDSKGQCQPALCDDPTFQSAACRYYTDFFGNSTDAMTLNWDPGMHFSGDSELVPMFPTTHRQYMASFLQLYQMLDPYTFVPSRHVFIAHGTPMGIPQNFTGTLARASTAVEYC